MSPASTSIAALLSADEILRAEKYLVSTREHLLAAVHSQDVSQVYFKPAPDRWCIAEIVEHVTMVENAVHGVVGRMPDAAVERDAVAPGADELVLQNVLDRSARFQAPPHLAPSLQGLPEETFRRFERARAHTLELLRRSLKLRGPVAPHPIFGPWDGYQWILATAAHSARHTEQIHEVKACTDFPRF